MPQAATTLTIFFPGSGNNLSEQKSRKFAVPHLVELAIGRHYATDGVGGNKHHHKRYQTNDKGFFKLTNGRKTLRADEYKGAWDKTLAYMSGSGVNAPNKSLAGGIPPMLGCVCR